MDNQEHSPRLLYWVIGLLAVVLIAGILTWLYIQNRSPETVTESVTPVVTPTSIDPVIAATTDITSTLADLDIDLASIEKDLSSTDDTAPSL